MDLSLFRLDSPLWSEWISGALAMFSWLAICAGGLFGILAVMVTHPPDEPQSEKHTRGFGLIGS